jgi:beta-galactosidase/beta-glucuronidase
MFRKDWVNLNGLWRYAIRPKAEAKPNVWDGDILVPFAVESALSGVMKPLGPDQRLWYHRSFRLPPNSAGQRLLLHFGAVDWQCTVWVSGREVGQHSGGYDPFTLDITDALKTGENDLDLAVWDPTDTGYQPHGKQVLKPGGITYTAVSGIWQTVWLEVVPADYIQSLAIVPDVDRGTVSVTVQASAATEVRLTARQGSLTVAQAGGAAGKAIELKIPNPSLWSPERPTLYGLEVCLVRAGRVLDTVTSYFGIRKIEVRRDGEGINRLMLNGKPLFQYGPLDQGWWPDGLYTAPSDEALQYDITTTKKLGMNMARKHVKVEPARWYYWCDRLGLIVWQDMPSGDSGRDDEAKANFRRELKAMIDALRPFPCIVMWIPFNEGWGQHDTAETTAWTEAYDPTRVVNEASGSQDQGTGAISDIHANPGPAMRPAEERRACVLGQFGGLGMPVAGHTWQAEKNWGYVSFKTVADLTDAYVDLLTRMRPLISKGLCAAVYTQTSDVEVEVNGLMTYDRSVVKMDQDSVAAATATLYLPPARIERPAPTSEARP